METMVADAVASTTETVTTILTTNIPVIMVIFAGLVGLGIAVHFIRKFIGRKA